FGVEERGVPVSYQCQSPVLGMVLPSNSPGVHTLWLPIVPLQVGLVLKPGPQEPWTPYRMTSAFVQAGVPKQAIAIYPGLGDIGAAVLKECRSEEHTSELQSLRHLVCRLLLEKKKKKK